MSPPGLQGCKPRDAAEASAANLIARRSVLRLRFKQFPTVKYRLRDMLRKPGWPAICLKMKLKIVQRESVHATSGFHENCSGRCGCDGGGACGRARADHLQLEDDQLLRPECRLLFDRPGRREGSRQAHRGDVERPHQDPVLRRRRTDPGGGRLRRRLVRHGRDELRQFVFLDRQELRRAILHRGAVRPQLPGLQRLDVRWRRPPALARGL